MLLTWSLSGGRQGGCVRKKGSSNRARANQIWGIDELQCRQLCLIDDACQARSNPEPEIALDAAYEFVAYSSRNQGPRSAAPTRCTLHMGPVAQHAVPLPGSQYASCYTKQPRGMSIGSGLSTHHCSGIRLLDADAIHAAAARRQALGIAFGKAACMQALRPGSKVLAAGCVDLTGTMLDCAQLEGATLHNTHAEGATFTGANMAGVRATDFTFERADLTFVDLSRAELRASVNPTVSVIGHLSRANLTGASLADATLEGFEDSQDVVLDFANLHRALLSKCVLTRPSLRGTRLVASRLDHTELIGAVASPTTLLAGTMMTDVGLASCNFEGVELSGARMLRVSISDTSLRGATFDTAPLDLDLTATEATSLPRTPPRIDRGEATAALGHVEAIRCRFDHARLSGAALSTVSFVDSSLEGASFSQALLSLVEFLWEHPGPSSLSGASGADFSYGRFEESEFVFNQDAPEGTVDPGGVANMRGTKFVGADLTNAAFLATDLQEASFLGASLPGAQFDHCNVEGADFTRATGTKAMDLLLLHGTPVGLCAGGGHSCWSSVQPNSWAVPPPFPPGMESAEGESRPLRPHRRL
ncbi:pentapeptide repeat protein [Emiliania huxleyi CCMP1516]|uniref:Pentapeptide repeat-containing protein n=2 Tax=Emiliania huxleyi TaxID=2903 RepID=A0A0D3JFK5_EMIH1|nr:pentapeptide repeat protein [Emiliania huxleyi CCMP1516]EOD22290.1 pentapeptide repeat protein [Emiliania huxleyi CCMP1516]|eukprot:XP_005774719.1 pentapeptide repeat protein [Emiliania huxleyi CCMP1516]